MGFFDKMTKAVGDAVDKGKKDIDQFMRIQKINGEISAIESKVAELRNEIQQNTQAAGQKAIELLRAGSVSNPELQVFADKLVAFERQMAAEQAAIEAKKADIERIKAEDAAPAAPSATPVAAAPVQATAAQPAPPAMPPTPPPLPAQPPADDVPPASNVPPVPAADRACPQCGKPLTGGAFCTECGANVG